MTIDSFLIIAQKLIINSTGADGFNPNWAFENFFIIGRLWAMQFVKSFFLILIIAFLFIGLTHSPCGLNLNVSIQSFGVFFL
jgi:hypothetical protein